MGRGAGNQAELEWRRMTAANMFEAGFDDAEVAAAVKAHVKTVGRWRRTLGSQGRQGIKSHKHPGRPPRLTAEQRQRLEGLLVRTPQECGFAPDRYLWTQQLIADLIAREFGGVARWLAVDWPAIKRGRRRWARPSCSPTRPAS